MAFMPANNARIKRTYKLLSDVVKPYLVASQVSFHRHSEAVFQPIDLCVLPGALCVVTGANGSGKTTLIRTLAGILPISEGSLERNASIAFIGHRPGIKDDLNCLDNLSFMQRFYPRHPARATLSPHQALKQVGLGHNIRRLAGHLSAGQRRRLALARLLVAPADVWLLDEPYTSLDTEACQWVDELLNTHLASRGAAIVTAHQRQPVLVHAVDRLEVIAGVRAQ